MFPWFKKNASLSRLSSDEVKNKLNKKNILIVGGTAGIGKALSIACLQRGANVCIVGRREPDAELSKATYIHADLSEMSNAVKLVEENMNKFNTFDIVVFTNGIFSSPQRKETPEKVELDLAVSYLSRFAIVKRMLKPDVKFALNRSDLTIKPRIFVMGYPGGNRKVELEDFNSEKKYKAIEAHMRTVVGNEALVTYLTKAEATTPLNVYGLNPGLIKTEIRDNFLGKNSFASKVVESMIGLFCQSAEHYAETTLLQLLVSPDLETKNGSLFNSNGQVIEPNRFLAADNNYNKVIEISEVILHKATNGSEKK